MTQYYHDIEKVKRARCPGCSVDFPLGEGSSISKIRQMRFEDQDPFSDSK